jgi:DNA adenine methylase
MKTPITYYGGKQRLTSFILPLIPPHKIYCEPFVGGGALFFAKPLARSNMINDKDDMLINLYRQMQENGEELFKKIDATLNSESDFKKAYNMLKMDGISDLDKAWAYFVNSQNSFLNKPGEGTWGINKEFPKHITWALKKIRLMQAMKKLEKTSISNRDALEIIKNMDSEETFFFVDPPYINTKCDAYKGEYTKQDYLNLIELLKTLKGEFILSNYPQPDIEMPNDWDVRSHTRNKSITKVNDPKEKTELFWANYKFKEVTK